MAKRERFHIYCDFAFFVETLFPHVEALINNSSFLPNY